MDRRPTLASWPKRIYEWGELPEHFLIALADWQGRGLPPENVTYIPRVNQYASDAEYVTAWFGGEVSLLAAQGSCVEKLSLCTGGEVVDYTVQLLKCTVDAALPTGRRVSFSYNKTKENQLLPVLNLLLGNPPEYTPRAAHPAGALEALKKNSYAMYHVSALCYRFGGDILDSLWLRGRSYGLGWRRQKPEWFLAKMERGLVIVATDFYGTRVDYLPWERVAFAEVEEASFPYPGPRRRLALTLGGKGNSCFTVPLLMEQREEAESFAKNIRAPGRPH